MELLQAENNPLIPWVFPDLVPCELHSYLGKQGNLCLQWEVHFTPRIYPNEKQSGPKSKIQDIQKGDLKLPRVRDPKFKALDNESHSFLNCLGMLSGSEIQRSNIAAPDTGSNGCLKLCLNCLPDTGSNGCLKCLNCLQASRLTPEQIDG